MQGEFANFFDFRSSASQLVFDSIRFKGVQQAEGVIVELGQM